MEHRELHQHQLLRALRSGTTTLYRPRACSDFHVRHSPTLICSLCTYPLPGTIYLLPSAISGTLDTFKTAIKTHLFNSACDATDSHPSAPPIHSSVTYGLRRQLKKSILID